MSTVSRTPGTDVQLAVTALNSLANSATAGWQSARVDNTTEKASEYDINISIDLDATAAANDKAIYVYVVPWFYDGAAWTCGADGGTATLPAGTEGTYTIGATHNLRPGTVITYTATGQVVNKSFTITGVGDGFSLVIINYTGAAIAASANVVQYKPVHYVSA